MGSEKKSRREVLKLIGKTGILLGTMPVFFASLKITPASEAGQTSDVPRALQLQTPPAQEKAFISGSGSRLTVKVNGRPGRVFFVAFAGADVRDNYRRLPGSNGTINARGTGSVVIDTKQIANTRIYLKVITGEEKNLSTQLAETAAFVITTREGVIHAFEGVVSRPILDSKIVSSQVLIAMAASSQDNNYRLR